MTDRIKYNEETGKVEVDADVWDMIVNQMPGNCIMDEVKTKELWKDKTLREAIAQQLGISPVSNYSLGLFSGIKSKFSLAELYPDCVILLPPITESKHEFQRSALTSIPKAKLRKLSSQSAQATQRTVDSLLAGRVNNPTASSLATISKITGVPIHRFIKSTLPNSTPCVMARIKQIAFTEKTNIFTTVMRELELTQAGLARSLGVNIANISIWMRGTIPRLDAYVAICKYFNVPFDYFSDWLE